MQTDDFLEVYSLCSSFHFSHMLPRSLGSQFLFVTRPLPPCCLLWDRVATCPSEVSVLLRSAGGGVFHSLFQHEVLHFYVHLIRHPNAWS